MFTDKDLEKIKAKGIEIQEIDKQIQLFQTGINFVNLVKPATPNDGIEVLEKKEIENLAEFFEEKRDEYSIVKFIPASGAASRMFKALFEALQALKDNGISGISGKEHLRDFFSNLSEYPFYEDLQNAIREKGAELGELQKASNFTSILEYVLTEKGLNYGSLPKGLLKFHSYKSGSRTAFEEHYEEASLYLANSSGTVNLHFTVSPEHMKLFTSLAETLTTKYKNEQGLLFTISFSVQSPSTDTIAVDLVNQPFRKADGELLFRPGGHGALLDNLNKLEESLIFVGNIDNVSPDNNKPLRAEYKKFLGGYLIKKIEKIHTLLDRIERGERGESLQEHTLQIIREISPGTATQLETVKNDLFNETAYKILNRPMRVCGMVRNAGEPGGGPFWVKNKKGSISKQIIESSQIDMENPDQKQIFMNSTHFNPVDLVCYIRDHKGEKFDLLKYRDPDMAFIAQKSQGGKDLKALELPGLWNGSMAHWLTWFVDVPVKSFTPVKTVFDLLRPEHL